MKDVQLVWRRAKVVSLVNLNRLGSLAARYSTVWVSLSHAFHCFILALPKAIVRTQYTICITANTNMKMLSWFSPSCDIRDDIPLEPQWSLEVALTGSSDANLLSRKESVHKNCSWYPKALVVLISGLWWQGSIVSATLVGMQILEIDLWVTVNMRDMNPNTISTDLSFSTASKNAVFLFLLSQVLRRWIKCSMKMEMKMKTKQTVARAHVGVFCKVRPPPPAAM